MPSDIDAFKKQLEKLIKVKASMPLFKTEAEIELPPSPVLPEAGIEDRLVRAAKTSLDVQFFPQNTFVVAISARSPTDAILHIPCRGGNALGGYVYDTLNDCYCIRGIDFCSLGYVPVAMRVSLGDWNVISPLPESVMRRYLNRRQKNDLKAFKEHYKDCKISFLQLVD